MSEGLVLSLARDAIATTIIISAPILILVLAIGLVISILQAVTQIQEQTLTFVPKILAVLISIALIGTWMLHTMVSFAQRIFTVMGNING
jgi:flagellar biosynthetic protein FliQ